MTATVDRDQLARIIYEANPEHTAYDGSDVTWDDATGAYRGPHGHAAEAARKAADAVLGCGLLVPAAAPASDQSAVHSLPCRCYAIGAAVQNLTDAFDSTRNPIEVADGYLADGLVTCRCTGNFRPTPAEGALLRLGRIVLNAQTL